MRFVQVLERLPGDLVLAPRAEDRVGHDFLHGNRALAAVAEERHELVQFVEGGAPIALSGLRCEAECLANLARVADDLGIKLMAPGGPSQLVDRRDVRQVVVGRLREHAEVFGELHPSPRW
ncbi:hypothetical protein ASD05_16625 [Variovorax sp. Root434]|nr:hypothetical protein ASD05_16625 [Variovorax sp. Root434]